MCLIDCHLFLISGEADVGRYQCSSDVGIMHNLYLFCEYARNTYLYILTNRRRFYRAMHFSAKRGIAIACRPSVCLSVRLSVTLVDQDHIGRKSWKSGKVAVGVVRDS